MPQRARKTAARCGSALASRLAHTSLWLVRRPCAMCENGVMFQYFHWHLPADGTLWTDLAERAPELAARGVTAVWIPPCYKGAGGANDVGYGVYDLFDLGEFDQKGSVRTKYGTKAELLRALAALKTRGI